MDGMDLHSRVGGALMVYSPSISNFSFLANAFFWAKAKTSLQTKVVLSHIIWLLLLAMWIFANSIGGMNFFILMASLEIC